MMFSKEYNYTIQEDSPYGNIYQDPTGSARLSAQPGTFVPGSRRYLRVCFFIKTLITFHARGNSPGRGILMCATALYVPLPVSSTPRRSRGVVAFVRGWGYKPILPSLRDSLDCWSSVYCPSAVCVVTR